MLLGMAYRIEYFKEGALVIAVPWTGSLDDTIEIAKSAVVSRGVDFARIMDVDGSGAEVWSGRKTPSEPA
jgi:hypothetical protein